jgi:RimJ/RimL family protein N-acetyltransferase
MRVERTQDADEIKRVVNHPQILAEFGVDVLPDIPLDESIYHMVAADDEPMGIASFFPVDSATWSPHMAVLPKYRGIGTELMRRAIQWVFVNTPCTVLEVTVPVSNKKMIHIFEKCGLKITEFHTGAVAMMLAQERN